LAFTRVIVTIHDDKPTDGQCPSRRGCDQLAPSSDVAASIHRRGRPVDRGGLM
jgi:hypothetical protein